MHWARVWTLVCSLKALGSHWRVLSKEVTWSEPCFGWPFWHPGRGACVWAGELCSSRRQRGRRLERRHGEEAVSEDSED